MSLARSTTGRSGPRWLPLARMEARRVLGSYAPWALAVALAFWLYRPTFGVGAELGSDITAGFLARIGFALVPLAVVLLCYRTVAGERDSGELQLAANLPLSRHELLVAKYTGRLTGVMAPVALALALVTVVGLVRHGLFSPARYLAILGLSVLYVAALVAILLAISASATRSVTAIGASLVALVLDLFWDPVSGFLVDAAASLGPVGRSERALLVLERLSPSGAYQASANWLLGLPNSTTTLPTGGASAVSARLGETPWYLHGAGGLAVLVAWLGCALAVAMVVFDRGDLL